MTTKKVFMLNGVIYDPDKLTETQRLMFDIVGLQPSYEIVDNPAKIERHLQSDEVIPVEERTHSG